MVWKVSAKSVMMEGKGSFSSALLLGELPRKRVRGLLDDPSPSAVPTPLPQGEAL